MKNNPTLLHPQVHLVNNAIARISNPNEIQRTESEVLISTRNALIRETHFYFTLSTNGDNNTGNSPNFSIVANASST